MIDGGYSEKWDYLDGFQYRFFKSLGSREEPDIGLDFDSGEIIRQPKNEFQLQFFPTAEGYYDAVRQRYVYHYTDHLGNIRLSYYKNSNGSLTIAKETNYYPFGLEHSGYNNLTGNESYKYQYNGKELQQEIGMYDYGARFYMPDIGRWGVVDPLAEKYPNMSPYPYVGSNPINAIDPDGRDIVYLNADGTINRVANNGSNYITVVGTDGKGRLLGSLEVSRGLMNWNNKNRQIVANVIAYYGNKIGAMGFVSTYEKRDNSIAYYNSADGKITVHPQSDGYLHPILNNKYDLMNVLYHENMHKYDDKHNIDASTFYSHANVAYKTVKHWTFKKSSRINQEGQVGYFSALIMNSFYQEGNERRVDSLINDFNTLNTGYELNFIKHRGIMEVTMPNGKKGEIKYEKSNNAPNLN